METHNVLACSFCQRKESESYQLIAGPTIYVCAFCVERCLEKIEPTLELISENAVPQSSCSFCGNSAEAVQIVTDGKKGICGNCLKICKEILAKERGIDFYTAT